MLPLDVLIAQQRYQEILQEADRAYALSVANPVEGQTRSSLATGAESIWRSGRRVIGRAVIRVGLVVAGPSPHPKRT